jgi:hypothetical protein
MAALCRVDSKAQFRLKIGVGILDLLVRFASRTWWKFPFQRRLRVLWSETESMVLLPVALQITWVCPLWSSFREPITSP